MCMVLNASSHSWSRLMLKAGNGVIVDRKRVKLDFVASFSNAMLFRTHCAMYSLGLPKHHIVCLFVCWFYVPLHCFLLHLSSACYIHIFQDRDHSFYIDRETSLAVGLTCSESTLSKGGANSICPMKCFCAEYECVTYPCLFLCSVVIISGVRLPH